MNFIGGLLAGLFVLGVGSAAATPTLDQSSAAYSGYNSVSSTILWGQTFTSSINGQLSSIDVGLRTNATPGWMSADKVTMGVYQVDSLGAPNLNAKLGSTYLNTSGLQLGDTFQARFDLSSQNITTTQGGRLAFTLTTDSGYCCDQLMSATRGYDAYGGGQLWGSSDSSNWTAWGSWSGITSDLRFSTYVDPQVVTRAPQNYGLFVGVRDGEMRGDLDASSVAAKFENLPNSKSFVLAGSAITRAEFQTSLDQIRNEMKAGDTLVLHVAAHGSSYIGSNVNSEGRGNEFVDLINFQAPNNGWFGLTDKDLTDMLRPFNDFNKMTFLDACHSGGFWSSNDLSETSQADLNTLERIALFAAAKEDGLTYSGPDGRGYFSVALELAWTVNPSTGKYHSDLNGDGAISSDELDDFLDDKGGWLPLTHFAGYSMVERAFGDKVPFDPNALEFYSAKSSDFSGVLAAPVPEPETYAMMLAGLALLGAFARRRQ